MTDRPQQERDDILAAVRELTQRPDDLYRRLHTLVPQQDAHTENIGSHVRISAAPIPWNTPAAMLYLDIHAGARDHETNLTLLLWRKATYRGGADALTREAIERLPILIDAAIDAGHHDHTIVRAAITDLLDWPVMARHVLDEARSHEVPWTKAPGHLECPHCAGPLYLAPGWKNLPKIEDSPIVCRRCRDDQGKRLEWAPTAWLAELQAPENHDPERLITIETAKKLWPDVRKNTLNVWVWRAVHTPESSRLEVRGTNRNGLPLFRLGDLAEMVGALQVAS